MLAHIGEREAAQKLQGAVERICAEGKHLTRDVGGTAGTAEFTDAVIAAMSRYNTLSDPTSAWWAHCSTRSCLGPRN
jgi:hypothetical protein